MEKRTNSVQDYCKFSRELKAQINSVKVLGRNFFQLDELCEWSIKNDATCMNAIGVRVNVTEDILGREQYEVYLALQKAVRDLDAILMSGEGCFITKEG